MPLKMTEDELLTAVTDLASLRGWQWVHFRPGRTQDGEFRTMVQGPLGKGWVDLIFVRIPYQILFVELKSAAGRISHEQEGVIGYLRQLEILGVDVLIWRPEDLDNGRIQTTLEFA